MNHYFNFLFFVFLVRISENVYYIYNKYDNRYNKVELNSKQGIRNGRTIKMNQTQNNELPSVAKIIIFMFLFPPLGLYYLHKRLSGNEYDLLNEGKGLRNAGIIYIFIAVFYAILFSTDSTNTSNENGYMLIYSILFIWGCYGYSLIHKGNKRRARANRIKNYYSLIMDKQIYSIDEIASIINRKYSDVLKEIQLMIDLGYLKNAYIDNNERSVAFPKARSNVFVQYNMSNESKPEEIVVVCTSCGGKNKVIKGKVTECEYCRSLLDSKALN